MLIFLSLICMVVCNIHAVGTKDIFEQVLDDISRDDPRFPKGRLEVKDEELGERKDPSVEKPMKEDVYKKRCPSSGIPYFKQLIRIFTQVMTPLEEDRNILVAKVAFTREQLDELLSVLNKDDTNANAQEILDFFKTLRPFQPLTTTVWEEVLKNIFTLPIFIGAIVGTCLLVIALFLVQRFTLQEISLIRPLIVILLFGFLFSIPWEWFRMYRVALSKKTSIVVKNIPEECFPKDLTVWKSVSLYFRNAFTFSDDKCKEYHESLLVDPVWEVSPLQATSVCLSRFLFEPMKHFSAALAESFRIFFKEIPVQWQPIIFVAIIIIMLVLIVSLSGLRIETPLLKINVNPRIHDDSVDKSLQNVIQPAYFAIDPLNNIDDVNIVNSQVLPEMREQMKQLHSDNDISKLSLADNVLLRENEIRRRTFRKNESESCGRKWFVKFPDVHSSCSGSGDSHPATTHDRPFQEEETTTPFPNSTLSADSHLNTDLGHAFQPSPSAITFVVENSQELGVPNFSSHLEFPINTSSYRCDS